MRVLAGFVSSWWWEHRCVNNSIRPYNVCQIFAHSKHTICIAYNALLQPTQNQKQTSAVTAA